MNKLTKTISAVLLLGFFLVPMFASAQLSLNENLGDVQEEVGYEETELVEVIGNVIRIVIGFIGLIALVIFIVGGFMWMTAGGSEDQIKKAKSLMKNAVIGIIIVVLAYAATTFIIDQLTNIS
ncbi:MAG TPA: pilin [Patescibacteria group bacterium]|nr:pilin [Patescibacteria group bacterium]